MSLPKSKKEAIYLKTRERFDSLLAQLQSCYDRQDLARASSVIATLRNYKDCYYCVEHRATMQSRGWVGVCGSCPLHKYGERLQMVPIPYNGCYKIGDYRNLIKSAFWFESDPCLENIKVMMQMIKKVIEHFGQVQEELTRED